ncbi:MAG: GSCFA domain-containing protein, partial [Bacteroidota bacterium]
MRFRTELNAVPFDFQVTHKDKLLFVGSCFSEHMGRRMVRLGIETWTNPYGILFNPLSIAENLRRSLLKEPVSDEEWVETSGRW